MVTLSDEHDSRFLSVGQPAGVARCGVWRGLLTPDERWGFSKQISHVSGRDVRSVRRSLLCVEHVLAVAFDRLPPRVLVSLLAALLRGLVHA